MPLLNMCLFEEEDANDQPAKDDHCAHKVRKQVREFLEYRAPWEHCGIIGAWLGEGASETRSQNRPINNSEICLSYCRCGLTRDTTQMA